MKRITIAALAAVAITFVIVAPASADVVHGDDNSCTPVAGVEHVDAVGTPTIDVSNGDYVAAVAEVSHVVNHEAVTHVEYEWSAWNWDTLKNDYRWSVNNPGKWWIKTGKTKVVEDTAAWSETVIDSPAVPGHAETFTTIDNPEYVPEVAGVEAVLCEWYTWNTGAWTPTATDASNVNWDQALIGAGKIAPASCEQTNQQDLYRGTRAEIDAVLADGILTYGEDFDIVRAWVVVSSKKCPTVVEPVFHDPTPPTCTTNGALPALSSTEGIVYAWDGNTETATAQDGFVLKDGVATSRTYDVGVATGFQSEDEGGACFTARPDDLSGKEVAVVGQCTAPLDGTFTTVTTTVSWTQGHVLNAVDGTWSLADKVNGEPVVTKSVAKDATCNVPVVPPVVPPVATPPVNLAHTGFDSSGIVWAVSLMLAGIGSVLIRKRLA